MRYEFRLIKKVALADNQVVFEDDLEIYWYFWIAVL